MNCDDMILSEDVFLNKVNLSNMYPIRVTTDIKLSVQMVCDEDTFLHIASQKTSEVFYSYEYPKDHEILITADTFEHANRRLQQLFEDISISEEFINDLDRTIYPESYNDSDDDELSESPYELSALEKQIKSEIISYNSQVNRQSLRIPREFVAFYNDYGCLCGICKIMKTPDWSIAEEALFSILIHYKEEIEKNITAKQDKKKEIKAKLKDILINDIQFKASKNKMLRREYANDLWNNAQFKWIRTAFSHNRYPTNEFFLFIERVYNEMKYYSS